MLPIGNRERLQMEAQRLGFGFVDVDRVTLDARLRAYAPEEVWREFEVLPARVELGTMWVIFAGLPDPRQVTRLADRLGCRVIPVVAEPDTLRGRLDEWLARGRG